MDTVVQETYNEVASDNGIRTYRHMDDSGTAFGFIKIISWIAMRTLD